MRAMKWTSLTLMLLLAFGATAQEEFFDDIYYSAKDKKEVKAEKEEVKKDEAAARSSSVVNHTDEEYSYATAQTAGRDIDVDAYNRRYDAEPEMYYEEEAEEEENERRSDLEYSERIVRFHSPSKLSIVGADQVDLYLSDGYYAYDYDTYGSNVDININLGKPNPRFYFFDYFLEIFV